MCALKHVYDLWWFLLLITLHTRGSHSSCAYFKTDGGSVSDTTATLFFSVMYDCIDQTPLENVKIVQQTDHPPHPVICSIVIVDATCDATEGCTCGSQSQSYSVKGTITQTQTWKLSGELQGGEQIQTEVVMIFEQEVIYHITDTSSALPENLSGSSEGLTFTHAADASSSRTESLQAKKTRTTDVVSTNTFSPKVNETRATNGKFENDFASAVVIVSVGSVVAISFATLVALLCLKRRIQDVSKRSSVIEPPVNSWRQDIWPSQAEISNAVYRGSNVSLMIINDIYDASASTSTTSVNVDRRAHVPLPLEPCMDDGSDGAVGGASPRWVQNSQREKMPLPPEAFETDSNNASAWVLRCEEEGDYTDINSLQDEGDKNASVDATDEVDVYMDIDELRKRAAERRERKMIARRK